MEVSGGNRLLPADRHSGKVIDVIKEFEEQDCQIIGADLEGYRAALSESLSFVE